jgi:hypothetical protein
VKIVLSLDMCSNPPCAPISTPHKPSPPSHD